MKKRKRKKNKALNIISKIIATIAIAIVIAFGLYVYKLDMLPAKYLTIIFIVLGIIYLILSLFAFHKSVKKGLKVFACIIFVLLSLTFGYGIRYVDKTYDFINNISGELNQKEEYYVSVSSDSKITNKNELVDKKIGVYTGPSAINANKAIEKLTKEINVKIVKYDNLEKMFESLQNEEVTAVFLNDSQKSVLQGDLSYLQLKLKDIYSIFVYIEKKESIVKIVNITNTPFNVYVAGGDGYGSINNVTNTDVNMIITVDPVNRKLLLTSIPRDYYVNLPSFGNDAYDKLTHAGYYGIEESIRAIEKLLDIDINYYVKVNFSTIEKVVDAIGGVDVYSDYSFCGNGIPDICYKKGNNHMNGYYALMFARERYAFPDGDIQRVKNQQKVLEAIIKKVSSSTTIISNYTKILDSISSNISTNIDTKSINKFVKIQLNDMDGWTIESQNLVGTDYNSTNAYTFPGLNLYVMKQNEESIVNARNKIQANLNKK